MKYIIFAINSICFLLLAGIFSGCPGSIPEKNNNSLSIAEMKEAFRSPPDSFKPWTLWFWINGNISKEGITRDLEALKRAGIGGVIRMEVKGAPDGPVQPLSSQWHECTQWAISECNRLEMEFGLAADFGYGSGGLHITPELSMQKLYWSETEVVGGQKVTILLPKPQVSKDFSASVRLHPGSVLSEGLLNQIELTDSYKDIAVIALPLPETPQARNFRIPGLNSKDGTTNNPPDRRFYEPPLKAIASLSHIVDLTGNMTAEGELEWNPPDGKWLIMRFGHASKYQLTKPGPAPVIGLECDRLAKIGIKTHYNAFLKNIFKGAGSLAGKSLNYVFIDSWEAGGQNWTASFPDEFHARRGYDIRTWLPVFAGRVLGSVEESERFLWDVRNTVSNLIRDNYFGHLHELTEAHGIKMAVEAYGHVCTDNLSAAGSIDMPVAEFWRASELPANPLNAYAPSSKVMSSAAHTYGKSVTGAEAFTSYDAWQDHPYILKASGDKRFCEGINRMILHCSTHQPYDNMVPGLTHHRWGGHFDRFNTWWDYAKPWMEYLTRCQFLLRQGEFVADVAYCYGEGAPLNVNFMQLDIPRGYDFDFCSSEMMLQMSVKNGRIVLPSGMSYRYLKLPDTDRMTLTLVSKIKELVDAGAKVIGGVKPMGSPSLSDSFENEKKIREIAAELWDSNRVISGKTLSSVFREDQLPPDFEGGDLHYIHRRTMDADIYFISHQDETTENIICTFRISGKQPELWDPETGLIRELPEFNEYKGRISIDLHFEPRQSWFVVFRERNESSKNFTKKRIEKNFKDIQMVRELNSQWQVSFDPKWGGPVEPVIFNHLSDWSTNDEPSIKYYSGTAVYRTSFELDESIPSESIFLDLGSVEIIAHVKLNGQDCGIAWKPPYKVNVTDALRKGKNELEISVVNLWTNRLIGDEQLSQDATWIVVPEGNWKDCLALYEWPEWFKTGRHRTSGRYTFTSCIHYRKDSPLLPSGLLGPVSVQSYYSGK